MRKDPFKAEKNTGRRKAERGSTRTGWWIAAILSTLLFTGCAALHDPQVSQEYHGDILGAVSNGSSMGQTLQPQKPDLNGITFWFATQDPQASLTLEVFPSITEKIPLYTATYPVHEGENDLVFRPPIPGESRNLYVRLTANQGSITVMGRNENSYLAGEAFANDLSLDGDLAFRTTYPYDGRAFFEDLRSLGRHAPSLAAAALLLVIPGWLVLDGLGLRKPLDPEEQAALSIGLSLAILPLLMLWTTVLGLRWGQASVRGFMGALAAIFFWRVAAGLQKSAFSPRALWQTIRRPSGGWTLAGIFLLTLLLRLAMVRDLVVPPWVDSVHHALIAEGIVQAGGYPPDYLPHIPFEARYYHPGYHGILAFYHWLSGLAVPQAMLLSGQVLNALSVFAVYALTTTLVKDRNAALGAAMVTGLYSIMPAYYTSWGRYTQLTGLLVLPTALALLLNRFPKEKKLPWLLAAALSLAGLTLIHYRAAFFSGCLLLAAWVGQLYRPQTGLWNTIRRSILAAAAAGLGAGILVSPWLVPALPNLFLPVAEKWGIGSPQIPAIHWRYFTQEPGIVVLVMAGLGLLLSLFQRRRFAIVLLVWVGLLFAAANPAYFHLPFPATFINQGSVEIMLFLPLSLFAGYLASEALHQVISRSKPFPTSLRQGLLGLAVLAIALLGAGKLLPVLNPSTFLFRNEDQAAIAWIEANIPIDETVVINPTGWGYGLYMGQDGGYWISPMAGRATMPPNALYGFNDEQVIRVNTFVEALLPIAEDPQAIGALLSQYGYRFIYIGGRGGVLSPEALQVSSLFRLRYHQGQTWVFEAAWIP